MPHTYQASLEARGDSQILTIPQEFTLSSKEVIIRKEGDRLVIEPIRTDSLLALLSTLEDIEDKFPNVDEGLLPLDDIVIREPE
ncbi:MAG: AbrB/MazE/SpoVT family DNA-binding domain-containing protein [Cyanobacteria bacterium J06628_6]